MRFKINIDVFGRIFFFYFGDEEFDRFMKDTKTKQPKYEIDGWCIENHIWIKNSSDITTIVHELHHTVTFITKKLGIKDEETQAYLQEYLLEQVCAKLDMKEVTFHLTKDNKK